jgi:hypothetical protein
MATIIHAGSYDWKLLKTVTGRTAVDIPSSAKEIYVIGHTNSGEGGYDNIRLSIHIITMELDTTEHVWQTGFDNGTMAILAGISRITPNDMTLNGNEFISNSTFNVYYR